MKRFLMATALTCLLSVIVLAGDVPTGDFVSPPSGRTASLTSPGEIPTDGAARPISGATLTFIQALIGLRAILG